MSPDPKKFTPPFAFAKDAHVGSSALADAFRETAASQPDAFWRELAKALVWKKPFTQVLDWRVPLARWFEGGQINVSENCIDKHLKNENQANKTAFIWEGEPMDPSGKNPKEVRRLSYLDLAKLVNQIASALRTAGIKKGDRVAIYMPLVPETAASMLACARIGAVHTVIFGGFSKTALADRIEDSKAKVLITADGTYRKGQWLNLKNIADEALELPQSKTIQTVFVYQRDPTQECKLKGGRDKTWKDSVLTENAKIAPESLESEDPLFILYTSGTTGKPKGLFHTQAGYLLWAHWTSRWLFDLKPTDIYWCSADFGWITGHTYVAYGPLSNGSTVFIYEGGPLYPDASRFWKMIDRHHVTCFYTSPTAIRTFMRSDPAAPKSAKKDSLRILGSVGEPINPEAWEWFHREIGNSKCPIVDTYWQTETGGVVISTFPGADTTKPGFAGKPLPGIEADVVALDTGYPVGPGQKGVVVINKPWPAMARGIWGDPLRFEKTYWNTSPALQGVYVCADFAMKDEEGDFQIEGRMDDVIKISGHRLGSAEIESALVGHSQIAEAAAVGIPDPVKGQACVAFVTPTDFALKELDDGKINVEELKNELRSHIGREIGALAKPDQIRIARALPKTRSGKIMRRLLRELAEKGKITGDTTTLEDFNPSSLDEE